MAFPGAIGFKPKIVIWEGEYMGILWFNSGWGKKHRTFQTCSPHITLADQSRGFWQIFTFEPKSKASDILRPRVFDDWNKKVSWSRNPGHHMLCSQKWPKCKDKNSQLQRDIIHPSILLLDPNPGGWNFPDVLGVPLVRMALPKNHHQPSTKHVFSVSIAFADFFFLV